MKFATKTIHGTKTKQVNWCYYDSIYQTSTYIQESPGKHNGYEYSRTGNPTRSALERNIAGLESGKYGLCFGSGLATIDAIIKLLNPGDEVISTNDLPGGVHIEFYEDFCKI